MISLRTSSGLRQVGAIALRTASGLRTVSEIVLRTSSGLRTVYSVNSAISVSPTSADGYISSKGAAQAYTNYITVSGYSGTPSSIVWTVPTGWTVINQGSNTTSFRSPPIAAGTEIDGDGAVTVSFGSNTATATFDLFASNQGAG